METLYEAGKQDVNARGVCNIRTKYSYLYWYYKVETLVSTQQVRPDKSMRSIKQVSSERDCKNTACPRAIIVSA